MDKLPLLLANNREGEGKISQYFGCRTLKDLSTRVLEEEINVNLDRQLGAHLEKIKPYLLAYAVEKAGSLGGNREASVNPQQKALETLSITPVKSLSYRYEIEMNDMRQYDNGIKLNETRCYITEMRLLHRKSVSRTSTLNLFASRLKKP